MPHNPEYDPRTEARPHEDTPRALHEDTIADTKLMGWLIEDALERNLEKGEWEKYLPSAVSLLQEISLQQELLKRSIAQAVLAVTPGSIQDLSRKQVRKHAASLAAYSMKAALLFGDMRSLRAPKTV